MRPGAGVDRSGDSLAGELTGVLSRAPIDVAAASLVIAKLEFPQLDPRPSLAELTRLGDLAAMTLDALGPAPVRARVAALNRLLFTRERFSGNRAYYDDFRNSLLNVVLERRLGIPISLAVVYMEVARRAGIDWSTVSRSLGISSCGSPPTIASPSASALILDPFDGGAELDDAARRALLSRVMGEDVTYDDSLLRICPPRQLVARLLNNLKRTYVELRLFRQAHRVTDLLLSTDPTLLHERRDRGLLAYHLDDFPAALSDLEDYVRLNAWSEPEHADEADKEEQAQIQEHIKNLRRRVASMN